MNTNFTMKDWEEISKLYNIPIIGEEILNDKKYIKMEFPQNIAYIYIHEHGYSTISVKTTLAFGSRSGVDNLVGKNFKKSKHTKIMFIHAKSENLCFTNEIYDVKTQLPTSDLLSTNFVEIDFSDFFKENTVNVVLQHNLNPEKEQLFKLTCQKVDDNLIRSIAFDVLNRNEPAAILADVIKDKYLAI